MNIPESGSHKGRVRAKKASLRVDLTPMVDLAFLLITFFMLTTTLLEQRAMRLDAPEDKGPQTPVSECQVLNVVTDSLGHIYYWEGLECKTKKAFLKSNCLRPSGKPKDMICLIKLLPGSPYENMVRVLDEVASDSVPIYAVQAYSPEEVKAVSAEQTKMAMSTP